MTREDLRNARLNLGLSQRALAAAAGVPRVTVQNLETGRGGASPENAKRIGDVLGMSAVDVLGLTDHPTDDAA